MMEDMLAANNIMTVNFIEKINDK